MIKFRKNPFSETVSEYEAAEDELISNLVPRILESEDYPDAKNVSTAFQVLVNGRQLDSDLWQYVKVRKGDEILVAPKIERGEGGQLFKQILILAVTIAATVFLSPAVGGGVYGALAVTAVSIATTLALNSLIPPPGLPGLGGNSANLEESQMYSITAQGNATKKFGNVPKVYGTHKIFPVVAANPYTVVQADPSTGLLVQFYYAIYDLGFGPMSVGDIKIGSTRIEDYQDTSYRLVDLNKPKNVVDEPEWDKVLYDNFEFYKGDVENDGTTVSIDKNQNDGGPADDYQVIRSASNRHNGDDQEITLDFVAPEGLISYGTDGSTAERVITLDIQFSKVGENIWHPFTDRTYVYDYSAVGGLATETYYSPVTVLPFIKSNYTKLREIEKKSLGSSYSLREFFGYAKGQRVFTFGANDANVGDAIIFNGNVLGKIISRVASSIPGYQTYTLAAGIPVNVEIFEWEKFTSYRAPIAYDKVMSDPSLENKISRSYDAVGGAIIRGKTAVQVYATVSFKPREKAQYKIKITRVSSVSTKNYQTRDRLTLTSITTRFARAPILTKNRHVFLEVKIRATNQLNGAIQNLSAVATSVLDTWDGTKWVKEPTGNPAWVYCDLLTGPVNKKAIGKDRLHLPSIVEWANFCDEIPPTPPGYSDINPLGVSQAAVRFESNFVLDFNTTLQALINAITGASQASMNIVEGKYGILVDKLRTTPVQIFTPRNSWGFTSQRTYHDMPHALKVTFVDSFNTWDIAEATIYDDGYDEETATKFDELPTFACTNYNQAWRFGRYMMAQAKLRKETININVDFEHLVCTRGDFVQITQDVMRAGGVPARVLTVDGNLITIDDGIETLNGINYGYVYRSVEDGIKTSTLTVVNADTFEVDGDIPKVGDLIVIGQVGKIVMDCIVRSIVPDNNLSASISLVERAPEIYLSESTGIIPAYNPNLNLVSDTALATPGKVEDLRVVENSYRVTANAYEYFIDLDWGVPIGSAYEIFEIHVDSGGGYNLWDTTKESFFEYDVNPRDLGVLHKFKVVAVSANGKKINLIEAPEVTATPLKKVTPPSNVEALYINITNEVISLDWTAVLDIDLKEYLIRYSPRIENASWAASIPLLRADRNTTLASTQGRTGTYLIKAVDLNGNESLDPAIALTSIPNLFDLNFIEETNDFPGLPGSMTDAVKDGPTLLLKKKQAGGINTNEYHPFGYYYYNNFLDLGSIYTVRLQSLIEAEGSTVGDLMANWTPLSDLVLMTNARQADWDVKTQYRTTNTFNVMGDWDSLSDIAVISEGEDDDWTEWRDFTIGDATGRIFQFRLKLISNIATVTPRVFEGKIKADMPDRIASGENIVCPIGGMFIAHTPAFKGPLPSPNIQLTQDDAQSGDYFQLTQKDLEGFYVEFFNVNGTSVSRQFDYSAKGFGRRALRPI